MNDVARDSTQYMPATQARAQLFNQLLGPHGSVDAALASVGKELHRLRRAREQNPLPSTPKNDVPGHGALALYRRRLDV